MKKVSLFLLIFFTSINLFGQELTCSDFINGEFYIPKTEEMAKYTIVSNDSISEFTYSSDSETKQYVVIRDKNTQVEWKNGIGNGVPVYEIIEWIDDCKYRLTYDSTKSELDEQKKWINENNGIIVSKVKIESNCMFHTATMTTNSGQEISQNGIICKK